MASLRKKPGTRYWVACFTDANGRQRQRSTKSTNRAAAQRIADGFEALYRRRQTETQVRRTMADIFEEVHGEPLCAITVKVWFDRWLERIKPEIGQATYQRYTDMARLVLKTDPEMGARLLDRVEPRHILELRSRLFASRAASTTNQTIKIFRQSLKAAWVDGLIVENPALRISRVRPVLAAEDHAKRPFTLEELRLMLRKADDEWRGMILAGLYSAGQRLRDVATLTAGQVDLQAGVVRFLTDKTGRTVIVPIVEAWRADLKVRLAGKAPGDRLFPDAYARFVEAGDNVGRISNTFRRLLARCGLATKSNRARAGAIVGRRQVSPLSFHSLRHTATSMLKNAGVSDSITRDIVGHESAAVSQAYTHIDEGIKRAAMEKMPALL